MLTFLALCARRQLVVDSYHDKAGGFMEKDPAGRLAVTRVELSPEIQFSGTPPDRDALAELHEQSHEQCFIANSVKTRITLART